MSITNGFNSQPDLSSTHTQTIPTRSKFVPSPSDWKDYKQTIIDLYDGKKIEGKDMTLDHLAKVMETQYGFKATKKMYLSRLHGWGIRRNIKTHWKDAWCTQLLHDQEQGVQSTFMTAGRIRKLLRYCRDRQGPLDARVIEILRSLENRSPSAINGNEHELGPAANVRCPTDAENFVLLDHPPFDDWLDYSDSSGSSEGGQHDTATFEYFGSLDTAVEPSSGEVLFSGQSFDATVEDDQTILAAHCPEADGIVLASQNYPPSEAISTVTRSLKLIGPAAAVEDFLYLTRTYRAATIDKYLLIKSTDPSADITAPLTATKSFWTSIKSAIYFFKVKDESLAFDLLRSADRQLAEACKFQALPFLRELLVTLSVVNTRVRPGLREELLKTFARATCQPGQPNNPLHAICVALQQQCMSDDALTVALCAVTRTTESSLDQDDDEVFELRRATVRLLRWRKDFTNAELMARKIIQVNEEHHSRDSVKTRLAISELIYVLNDMGRYTEAHAQAEDVINRGQRDEGLDFPSQRSVYAMEDVAEICDRLGKKKSAVMWLKRALKGALRLWVNREATVHINDKLEKLREEIDGTL